MEISKEKWQGNVSEVVIGATSEEGGSRSKKIVLGGHGTLPFLHFEAPQSNPPVVALEVHDCKPAWPKPLIDAWGEDVLSDPKEWLKKAVSFNPDLICIKFLSADPDIADTSPEKAAELLSELKSLTDLPLIVVGCANKVKDTDLLPELAEAVKGERVLLGEAVQDNYRTIAAACQSTGHNIIAQSPLDINLAKQLNILLGEVGLSPEKIVIHHTTGALGYGLEYCYSIMERCRLAALSGDKMMSSPMINFVGQEVSKSKEARAPEEELPQGGPQEDRLLNWEVTTSVAYLQAGADILVLNHPESLKRVRGVIDDLMSNET